MGIELKYFRVVDEKHRNGEIAIPNATIEAIVNGELKTATGGGQGPVDALYNAIDNVIGRKVMLVDWSIQAKGMGSNAPGVASLIIEDNNIRYVGKGESRDIIEAAALAYIDALNRVPD